MVNNNNRDTHIFFLRIFKWISNSYTHADFWGAGRKHTFFSLIILIAVSPTIITVSNLLTIASLSVNCMQLNLDVLKTF